MALEDIFSSVNKLKEPQRMSVASLTMYSMTIMGSSPFSTTAPTAVAMLRKKTIAVERTRVEKDSIHLF